MKKLLAVVLTIVMVLSVMAVASADDEMRVAMITDYGDITDQSFNQTTYEAAKAWCDAMGVDFTYYKPAGDSTAERVAMVEKADDDGYNVIIMPGYAFGGTIAEVAAEYPDVKFVKVNVDDNMDLAGEYGIMSIPQVYIFKDGEVAGKMSGYRDAGGVRAFIDETVK